jgi:orotate phosphoribosyltransferase
MRTENEVFKMLREAQAVITDDHLVYTSGKHGDTYVNKDTLYPHTEYTSRVGELFAQNHAGQNIDVVVGPALGGIILSQWTASHLSAIEGREIFSVYTEKDADENQVLRRGYDKVVQGKKVLIVEDVTTTGGSVKKVMQTVFEAGGTVAAVGVMVNRDPENVSSETIQAPFSALLELPTETWDREDCPHCKSGRPVNTSIGHGKKFVEGHLPVLLGRH